MGKCCRKQTLGWGVITQVFNQNRPGSVQPDVAVLCWVVPVMSRGTESLQRPPQCLSVFDVEGMAQLHGGSRHPGTSLSSLSSQVPTSSVVLTTVQHQQILGSQLTVLLLYADAGHCLMPNLSETSAATSKIFRYGCQQAGVCRPAAAHPSHC